MRPRIYSFLQFCSCIQYVLAIRQSCAVFGMFSLFVGTRGLVWRLIKTMYPALYKALFPNGEDGLEGCPCNLTNLEQVEVLEPNTARAE